MNKALALAALALTLTACAGTHVASHGSTTLSSAPSASAEAWRLAIRPNAARLASELAAPGHSSSRADAAPEAWQLAIRPNATRLAHTPVSRGSAPQQLALVTRTGKAMP